MGQGAVRAFAGHRDESGRKAGDRDMDNENKATHTFKTETVYEVQRYTRERECVTAAAGESAPLKAGSHERRREGPARGSHSSLSHSQSGTCCVAGFELLGSNTSLLP